VTGLVKSLLGLLQECLLVVKRLLALRKARLQLCQGGLALQEPPLVVEPRAAARAEVEVLEDDGALLGRWRARTAEPAVRRAFSLDVRERVRDRGDLYAHLGTTIEAELARTLGARGFDVYWWRAAGPAPAAFGVAVEPEGLPTLARLRARSVVDEESGRALEVLATPAGRAALAAIAGDDRQDAALRELARDLSREGP